jgi:hypothetical protein
MSTRWQTPPPTPLLPTAASVASSMTPPPLLCRPVLGCLDDCAPWTCAVECLGNSSRGLVGWSLFLGQSCGRTTPSFSPPTSWRWWRTLPAKGSLSLTCGALCRGPGPGRRCGSSSPRRRPTCSRPGKRWELRGWAWTWASKVRRGAAQAGAVGRGQELGAGGAGCSAVGEEGEDGLALLFRRDR